MAKKQFFKTFFLDSTYRGYHGHFPDIAIATAKFLISRYRDDRDLSVCLGEILIGGEILIRGEILIGGEILIWAIVFCVNYLTLFFVNYLTLLMVS